MSTNSLKQYELAELLDIQAPVLNRWINAKTAPHDSTIYEVAEKLGYEITKHIDGNFYFKDELPQQIDKGPIRNNIEELQQIASELTDKDLQIRMLQALNSLSNERAKLFEEISSIKSQLLKIQ